MGKKIDAAIDNYHKRTGSFIRDQATLFAELGISELNDRFGRPYYFSFYTFNARYVLDIMSVGNDGIRSENKYVGDDFNVWNTSINYADDLRIAVDKLLNSSKEKPTAIEQFKSILERGGMSFANIRDGYNNSVYLTTRSGSRFVDQVKIVNRKRFGENKIKVETIITPVTEDFVQFDIRSAGSNGKEGDYDDFTLTSHVIVTEVRKKEAAIKQNPIYKGKGGTISGVVKDSAGAIVPAISVRIWSPNFVKTVVANDSGFFAITGLPPGTYEVSTLPEGGFAQSQITNIVVTRRSRINIEIIVFASEEGNTVDVTAGDAPIDTTSSEISNSVDRASIKFPAEAKTQIVSPPEGFTPRLREYFPETLLWMPELITGADGKITANFKMADNITTWKMYAIASDKKGNLGLVESETTAFQSFFVDLDPPKFLTQGDEISLPVQVRNYTASALTANVSMAKADWFSITGKENLKVNVAAGKSENAVFTFKANSFIDPGKQRVTAIADKESDAIEKPVTVRPNGQEVIRPESKVFTGSETFAVDFPATAIKNTPHAELKIYPNLFSHVSEAVDGLLQRPYGCGEQLISSSYPNLMILKYKRPDKKLKERALKNLQEGYDRLIGYQSTGGGFTYWGGNSEPNIALTAYAIRFLNDAKEIIAVDKDIIAKAEKWLIGQQQTDGTWAAKEVWPTEQTFRRRQMLTSYVARTLAMQKPAADDPKVKVLETAFRYLAAKNEQIAEPHTLALYGLALLDSDNAEEASRVAAELADMAMTEGDGEYWKLETNTPFYGWGTPGRIETTALVVQLLSGVADAGKYKERISKGLIFLLKNKDRYGVWYSTQTTINVLDTFLALIAAQPADAKTNIEIKVNGKPITKLSLTAEQIEQRSIDLTPELSSANNLVEVVSDGISPIMAQVVKEHYVAWENADISSVNMSGSRTLALQYNCGTGQAAVMEEITCSASIERIAFSGYGMLMAELGTPPGADIDRESLDKAVRDSYSISRYEVLPDRVVFYMYASAGGTNFTFKFRPRYAINAQTPASVAYDYYNPLARAETKPLRFVVK